MRELSSLRDSFYDLGKVEDCPVYDLHGHMGPFYGAHMNVTDTAEMIRVMDRAGVATLVFCSHASLLSPDIGNAPSIEAVREYPDRFRAYCGINPNYPDIVDRDIETFDHYKDVYVGFKLLPDYHGVRVDDDGYRKAWEMADERRLMALIHTWGGSSFTGYDQICEVAGRYPNAKILLGHSLHGEWDKAIDIAKRFPNTCLELCAVIDQRGVLEQFVDNLGSERIIFGTDFPWFDYHYYIGAILEAEITDDDRRNIFYRNAQSLLGMPPTK